MEAVVGIISRRGHTIGPCYRNQPNTRKEALDKPLLYFYNHLKPYISNKMDQFSYISGYGICGHTRIKAFKRRTGLGYR